MLFLKKQYMRSRNLSKVYSYWRKNLYKKIPIKLLSDRKVLDVGCGEGEDAFNISKYAKEVFAIDIEDSEFWKKYSKKVRFKKGDAGNIPFNDNKFSGIFLKDVLHHVKNPKMVLSELNRVTGKGSIIIIVEGNRYNPIFYIHMTRIRKHEHLSQYQFQSSISKQFKNVKFYQFESHYIPVENLLLYKCMSFVIAGIFSLPVLNRYKSYNMAIINK